MKTENEPHTLGPWKISNDQKGLIIEPVIPVRNCSYIAVIESRGTFLKTEREANARLIAAAPFLLAALQGLERYARTLQEWKLEPGATFSVGMKELYAIEKSARLAIDRAEGKTQNEN